MVSLPCPVSHTGISDGIHAQMAITVTKHVVTSHSRKLSSTWTFEEPQTLRHTAFDEAARILTEEIDAQILAEIYKTNGWYLVPLTIHSGWTRDGVTPWLKQHYPSGGYHVWSGGCMFRDREMAVEFELTWT
jgi:hypothetical protein